MKYFTIVLLLFLEGVDYANRFLKMEKFAAILHRKIFCPDGSVVDCLFMPASKYYMEILEVVDHLDRVMGTERRGVIHERGLMHRSAQALVFNSQGELFLQKRSRSKDEFPGLWDSSAAGHVNPGESYQQCALRELQEELGIEVDGALQRLFKFPASKDTGFEHCTVFRCDFDGPLDLQSDEVDDGKWLTPGDMNQLVEDTNSPLTPAIRNIWLKFRSGC
jgi:isopentenyl-diphosphate delta-isomerase type 1